MSGTLPVPYFDITTEKCNNSKIQADDSEKFFKSKHKNTVYKLIYETLEECAFGSNDFNSGINTKVKTLLLEHCCEQVFEMAIEGQDSCALLELQPLEGNATTYNESIVLISFVKMILQQKYESICNCFTELISEYVNKGMNREDKVLQLRNKFEEQQRKYLENLLEEQEVLQNIIMLRLEKLHKVCEEKISESIIITLLSEIQLKIVNKRAQIDIFMESHSSLSAYDELLKDVKEQQEECQTNIQFLRKLKQDYEEVSCKQYDELLRSFIQYESSLKKMELLHQLKSCEK